MPLRVAVQAGGGMAGVRVGGGRRAVQRALRRAVTAALEDRGVADAVLSVTLLGDRPMADLNRRYLRHDGPTDVLSFALYGPGERVVGDVYIGFEQAVRQAAGEGVPLDEELVRLAVHGTLHVLGMEHPEGTGRRRGVLWRTQERIVQRLRDGA